MKPVEFARAECANFFGGKGKECFGNNRCTLITPGDRCAYFEQSVKPMVGLKEGKKYLPAAVEYDRAVEGKP